MIPKARISDPETSHEAAASLDPTKLSELMIAIIQITREAGKITDGDLISKYYEYSQIFGWEVYEPQTIRSRRSDLVKAGKIEFSGEYGITRSGRRTRMWKIA